MCAVITIFTAAVIYGAPTVCWTQSTSYNSLVLFLLDKETEAQRREGAWPRGDARCQNSIPSPGRTVSIGRRGSWGPGASSHKLRAGLRVVQQDLELGAHVEVAPVDRDPGAAGLGAHSGLQGVDQGQLWVEGRWSGLGPAPRGVCLAGWAEWWAAASLTT